MDQLRHHRQPQPTIQLEHYAQQLAIDLADYAHHHTNQACELSEVAPLLLRARDRYYRSLTDRRRSRGARP